MKKVLKKLKDSVVHSPLHDDILIFTRLKVDIMDFRDNYRKNRRIRRSSKDHYNAEINDELIWDELFRRAAEI